MHGREGELSEDTKSVSQLAEPEAKTKPLNLLFTPFTKLPVHHGWGNRIFFKEEKNQTFFGSFDVIQYCNFST